MPADVIVSKRELMEVLQENRARHRETFLKAQEGFRARVIRELDQRLADARDGRKIDLVLRLPEPEDHTADYDREIRMLEMHTEDTVLLSAHLFDQVVMDNWGWSAAFNSANSAYLA